MSERPIDHNLTSLFEDMVHVLDGSVERRPWGTMHRAFPANPMFNGVWTEPSPDADWHDAVGDALAFFAERATPLVFWWMTDTTGSGELQVALADTGFVPFELNAPVLVGRIDDLTAPLGHPRDLQIRVAVTQADLAAWRDVFVTAFGVPASAAEAWCDATLHAGPRQAPLDDARRERGWRTGRCRDDALPRWRRRPDCHGCGRTGSSASSRRDRRSADTCGSGRISAEDRASHGGR